MNHRHQNHTRSFQKRPTTTPPPRTSSPVTHPPDIRAFSAITHSILPQSLLSNPHPIGETSTPETYNLSLPVWEERLIQLSQPTHSLKSHQRGSHAWQAATPAGWEHIPAGHHQKCPGGITPRCDRFVRAGS